MNFSLYANMTDFSQVMTNSDKNDDTNSDIHNDIMTLTVTYAMTYDRAGANGQAGQVLA